MTIHTRMIEQLDLSRTYAQDGAFRSAANVLRRMADELVAHADACDPTAPKPITTTDMVNFAGSSGGGGAVVKFNGRELSCKLFANGKRTVWYIDGQRTSRAHVDIILNQRNATQRYNFIILANLGRALIWTSGYFLVGNSRNVLPVTCSD